MRDPLKFAILDQKDQCFTVLLPYSLSKYCIYLIIYIFYFLEIFIESKYFWYFVLRLYAAITLAVFYGQEVSYKC